MKLLTLLLLLLVGALPLSAQFVPAPLLPADTLAYFRDLADRVEVIDPDVPEEFREKIAEINGERLDDLKTGLRDSTFLFHPELQIYLDGLMARIVEANDLDVAPLVLIRRSQAPNAASYGGGIFTVNLGLFQSLAMEEKIIFVLCHEMAHDRLAHQKTSMLEYCQREATLKGTRRKLSRRRTKKWQRKSLISDVRANVYNSFRLKRKNELEADSLGLNYYSAMGLSPEAARTSLDTLGTRDLIHLRDVDFVGLLQTRAYPVKEKWFEAPDEMFGGSFGTGERAESYWAEDSVATHPDTYARQVRLEEMLDNEPTPVAVLPETPHVFGVIVDQEMIRSQTEGGLPGLAVVNGLRLLATDTTNTDYRALVGEAFFKTYQSIENHDFDEAVPPEGYFRDPSARLTVRMLRRMRKSELRKFTLAWLRERTADSAPGKLTELLATAETYFEELD